jgi:ankyrin repeat protein
MSNGQSWLPLHFAIVLFTEGKINEEDVQTLYSIDPMAMNRLSNNNQKGALTGCSPAHLLCMQKQPTMSLVHFFCLCNPKTFLLCDQEGRSVLHLVAMFSESLELLQSMLQIDHTDDKKVADTPAGEVDTALCLLCKRLEFSSFKEMVNSLIQVDCSVGFIYDGILGCMMSNKKSSFSFSDVSPGSRGAKILDLLKVLLNANSEVANYNDSYIFHLACSNLRGNLGIAVLNLFLTKNGDGIKCFHEGLLPIHFAACNSTMNMVKFLYEAYPESFFTIKLANERNLLHLAMSDTENHSGVVVEKVEYICEQCPQLIHMKDNEGDTPLHEALYSNELRLDFVRILCNADESVVIDKCAQFNTDDVDFDRLPLHLLIDFRSMSFKISPELSKKVQTQIVSSELSVEADCFRLFLRLYPASAGIKDGHSQSPYDLAVSENLNKYFIRLLLANDPTIDPAKRKDLNFEARREGMFLAFKALSTTVKPTIWAQLRYKHMELLARVMSYL